MHQTQHSVLKLRPRGGLTQRVHPLQVLDLAAVHQALQVRAQLLQRHVEVHVPRAAAAGGAVAGDHAQHAVQPLEGHGAVARQQTCAETGSSRTNFA